MPKLKWPILWGGLSFAGVAWGVALYWTLVAGGYVQTPWVL